MAIIVPALLSSKKDEMQKMLDSCSHFTNFVQIDIMDGNFVPSKSLSIEELGQLKTDIDNELHLMVENPFAWIKPARKINSKKIFFHLETKINHKKLIKEIKNNDIEAGVCLNPATNVEHLASIISQLDSVLFMSVNPGFYGSPFIGHVLDKIKKFNKKYPAKKIAIDGGIKKENFSAIKKVSPDYICIGSAILKASNPKQAFSYFHNLLNA